MSSPTNSKPVSACIQTYFLKYSTKVQYRFSMYDYSNLDNFISLFNYTTSNDLVKDRNIFITTVQLGRTVKVEITYDILLRNEEENKSLYLERVKERFKDLCKYDNLGYTESVVLEIN